jgi:hypothetical protein
MIDEVDYSDALVVSRAKPKQPRFFRKTATPVTTMLSRI